MKEAFAFGLVYKILKYAPNIVCLKVTILQALFLEPVVLGEHFERKHNKIWQGNVFEIVRGVRAGVVVVWIRGITWGVVVIVHRCFFSHLHFSVFLCLKIFFCFIWFLLSKHLVKAVNKYYGCWRLMVIKMVGVGKWCDSTLWWTTHARQKRLWLYGVVILSQKFMVAFLHSSWCHQEKSVFVSYLRYYCVFTKRSQCKEAKRSQCIRSDKSVLVSYQKTIYLLYYYVITRLYIIDIIIFCHLNCTLYNVLLI